MTPAQMETFRARDERPRRAMNGTRSKACDTPADELQAIPRPGAVRRGAARRRCGRRRIAVPETLAVTHAAGDVDAARLRPRCSTNSAQRQRDFAARIVTTSPDVTVSTNLGAWVNRRGLFARATAGRHRSRANAFPRPSTGILADGPAYRARHRRDEPVHRCCRRSALSHSLFGERLLPIGTLYDPFIARGLDALELRLLPGRALHSGGDAVGHDAGARKAARISRSRTPLIGMAQDGLAAFEPAFVDELAVILRLGASIISSATARASTPNATGCATRPAARSICGCRRGRSSRPRATMTPRWRQAIIDGAYWLREPGPNCQIVVAYQRRGRARGDRGGRADGRGPPRCRPAGGHLGRPAQCRLDGGLPGARTRPGPCAIPYRAAVRRTCRAIAASSRVIDGHPATLAWLGAVARPSRAPARRRAFRPDRLDRRPLPPLRHRRRRHHRGGRSHRAGTADLLPWGGVIRPTSCA